MTFWRSSKPVATIVLLLAATVASASLAQPALTRVTAGIANSASDVGLLVAQKRGYFTQEGLDVDLLPFDSAVRMIAPFASGELDVGAGGPSAALYNAVARGIDIRVVADKASTPPGRPINFLLVRKDHVESGRFRTLADLKGMKIAGAAQGASATTTLDKLLDRAGLTFADIERVFMSFPQQAIALQNKAVDAAMPTEPAVSEAVRSGAAVRIIGDDEIYPNHQIAVLFYSGHFIQTKPAAANAFMRAYLRGLRDYNDAITDGHLRGAKGEAIISILTETSLIRDGEIYRSIPAVNIDPDGRLNVGSLREDMEIFRKDGLSEGEVDLSRLVDTSFTEAAVKALGPYRPATAH